METETGKLELSSLTYLVIELLTPIDAGVSVRFDEIYEHLRTGDFLEWLQKSIGKHGDLSRLVGNEPALIRTLSDSAAAYEGRERRKAGVEKNGLLLLIAIIQEAIQRGDWLQKR